MYTQPGPLSEHIAPRAANYPLPRQIFHLVSFPFACPSTPTRYSRPESPLLIQFIRKVGISGCELRTPNPSLEHKKLA